MRQRYFSALNRAREIYLSTSPFAVFSLQYESDLVKKYYKQLAKTDYSILSKTIGQPKIEKDSIQPPTYGQRNAFAPSPVYDSTGELIGMEDPIQKMSRLPTPFEKMMHGKKKLLVSQSIPITIPRDLKRKDVVKDLIPLISSFMIKKKSKVEKLIDTTFRTTGSPIRMTKLTSLKSKGYIPSTPIKKQLKTKPLLKREKSIPVKKKKSKFEKDLLFSKKDKEKKKKNLWGF